MQQERKQTNRNRSYLVLDTGMFIAFLVVGAPRFSGLAIHEWLGVAFGAAIVTHLVVHWQWLVGVTKQFLRKAQWSSRVNYVLNALLFLDVTVIIFTGLMISEVALPVIGLHAPRGGAWRQLHGVSASVALGLIGIHLALHWSWIVNTVKRLRSTAGGSGQRRSTVVEQPTQIEA